MKPHEYTTYLALGAVNDHEILYNASISRCLPEFEQNG